MAKILITAKQLQKILGTNRKARRDVACKLARTYESRLSRYIFSSKVLRVLMYN